MKRPDAWKKRLTELRNRAWEVEKIRARLETLRREGFDRKRPDLESMRKQMTECLDRIQRRAEEYEYLTHSCAKGSALALMEAFGLGNWDMIRALSPFPGFGMTGGICGGVTGGLMVIGLFFGSDDPEDYSGNGRTMTAARRFITRFKEELGTISCPDLHEKIIFGRYMDPRASEENFRAFQEAQGYEKCALPAGVGARIAAEVILGG